MPADMQPIISFNFFKNTIRIIARNHRGISLWLAWGQACNTIYVVKAIFTENMNQGWYFVSISTQNCYVSSNIFFTSAPYNYISPRYNPKP